MPQPLKRDVIAYNLIRIKTKMPRALKTQQYVLKSDKTAFPPFTYCIRKPVYRRRKLYKSDYKKGFEVRISIKDIDEVEMMKSILLKKCIISKKPYKKHQGYILPIYGENQTTAFSKIITKAL